MVLRHPPRHGPHAAGLLGHKILLARHRSTHQRPVQDVHPAHLRERRDVDDPLRAPPQRARGRRPAALPARVAGELPRGGADH